MKKIGLIILSLVLALGARAGDPVKEDTVVIEFGERSKMIIYAETQEDLKDLSDYDINTMIGELNANLDSTATDSEEVSIVEDSDKYRINKDVDTDVDNKPLSYYGDDRYDDSDRYEQRGSRQDYGSRHEDYDDNDYVIIDRDRSRKRSSTYGSFQAEIGLSNWLQNGSFPDANNELHSVRPLWSWYFGLGGMNHTHFGGAMYLDWGASITWNHWKMENDNVVIYKGDSSIIFEEDPLIDGKMTKLSACYINTTVVPMFDFSHNRNRRSGSRYGFSKYRRKGFRAGVGMYMGYRLDSWTRAKYKFDGSEKDDKEKSNYFLNNFRYGIRTQVGYKGMDIFFNYDLNKVFATGRGPELNAISFGFIL
ncbi:hypothetical protein [Reichenbachiella sp.]|uniref:hypothetical protein n=1 Tax=Reichenbachiella sp. TaxID=2184521 RepID=UPI003B590F66